LKYLKATVVVLLIFGLPAGSYLYLRSGFMFRKDTLEFLQEKTPLTSSQNLFLENKALDVFPKLYNGVTLFQRIQSSQDTVDLYFLAESLEPRTDFNLVAIADSNHYRLINDTIFTRSITRIQSDKTSVSNFFEEDRFLLAKDSFIRMDYGYSVQEMLDVYEHAVVLLPMKKRDKVKLVRNKE